MHPVDVLLHSDCVSAMQSLPAGCVDLAFADPPFNIGYEYDVYDDRQERDAYLDWSRRWIAAVHRVLKADGTFWLAIGDEYAAELKLISQELGFHCRSWVVWYYTFGVHCTRKFTRSHAHLFHFVKDAESFTFNTDAIRVPSARQLVYNDARANPAGRVPDDTWILRPQDLPDGFRPGEDTWYFPRVAGTFKERAGFHGCQMPEQLLGRIIRCCSNPGELVLDPFAGSASTLVVAKKLGRRFLGCDLSEDYVKQGTSRLEATHVGDPLVGAPEPLVSAPATLRGRPANTLRNPTAKRAMANSPPARIAREQQEAIVAAFRRIHRGYSADYLLANAELNAQFIETCRKYGAALPAVELNRTLLSLRKSSRLLVVTTKRVGIADVRFDEFAFASEIAMQRLQLDGHSLDEILCDPTLAERFDLYAVQLAPGFDSFEYRWGALRLRKKYHDLVKRCADLDPSVRRRRGQGPFPVSRIRAGQIPELRGVYRILIPRVRDEFIGTTINLKQRLDRHFSAQRDSDIWNVPVEELHVSIYLDVESAAVDAFRQHLIQRRQPRLNYHPVQA